MSCETCKHLDEHQSFPTQYELTKAIRVLRANLTDGTLVELPDSTSFSELGDSGNWPDSFEYRFRCSNCAQEFLFSAETYHGQGGSWRPLNEAAQSKDEGPAPHP